MMRVDLKATTSMWKQTVASAFVAICVFAGLIIYFSTSDGANPQAVRVLGIFIILIPVLLSAAYFVRRFMEKVGE